MGAGKSLPPFCVTSALAWPRCTLDGWGLLCHSRQGPESQRGVSASSRAARTVPAQVTAGWPCSSGLAASPLALRVLPLCVPVPQPNLRSLVGRRSLSAWGLGRSVSTWSLPSQRSPNLEARESARRLGFVCGRGREARSFLSTREETPPTQPSTPIRLPRSRGGGSTAETCAGSLCGPGGRRRASLGTSTGAPRPTRFAAARLGHGIVPSGKGAGTSWKPLSAVSTRGPRSPCPGRCGLSRAPARPFGHPRAPASEGAGDPAGEVRKPAAGPARRGPETDLRSKERAPRRGPDRDAGRA